MTSPRNPPVISMRLCDPDDEDVYGAVFPHLLDFEFDDDGIDLTAGGGTFVYPRGGGPASPDGRVKGVNAELLTIKQTVVFLRNTVERRNHRFDIQTFADDVVAEGDDALQTVRYLITPMLHRFADQCVMPDVADGLAKPYVYENVSPVLPFLQQLHRLKNDYEALVEFNADFTAEEDSENVEWDPDTFITRTVEVGTPLLYLLSPEFTGGAVEAYCRKMTIRALVAGTGIDYTEDLGEGESNICLFRGKDLIDGPRQRDGIKIATHALVEGDGGKYVIVDTEDPDDYDQYGHIYRYLPIRGETDMAALEAFGVDHLKINHHTRDTITFEVALGLGRDPYDTFTVGDWIYVFTAEDNKPVRYRVRKISTKYNPRDNEITALITVNDWFDEHQIQIQNRLDGITRGADGPQGGAPPGDDKMAPAVPVGIDASTTYTYEPPVGATRSAIDIVVDPPVLDGDGIAPLYDLAALRLRYRYDGKKSWSYIEQDKDELTFFLRDRDPGADVDVGAAGVDTSGNVGPYTNTITVTAAPDNGTWRSFDALGNPMARIKDGRWFFTKVGGGVLDAVGPGIDIDSDIGVRLFGAGGFLGIRLESDTGDAYFHGNVIVDGALNVSGDTILGGDLTLAGNLDADGYEIQGAVITGSSLETTSGIVIEGSTITIGGGEVTWDGSGFVSFSSGAFFDGGIVVNGEGVFDSLTTGGALDHTGGTSGFNGAGPVGPMVLPGAGADPLVNAIRSGLINNGLAV